MVAIKKNGTKTEATVLKEATAVATKPAPATRPIVSGAGKSPAPAASPTFNPFAQMGAKMSTEVKERHLKILFWGPTGGGKTEALLRNFPGIACFDTEGNTDMCLDHPKIPPFLQIKTKDVRKIQSGIQAARQKVVLPNGIELETIGIDSGSVLWAVQSDVAADMAEQRAQRKRQDVDTANITQIDWTKAKRPLKRLMLEFSLTPVRYLVMTAREKDLYDEKSGYGEEKQLVKVGLIPDLVKNSLYEFNIAVRLWVEDGKRMYEITKVQGSLGEIFPQGSRGANFPFDKLLEHGSKLEVGPEDDLDGEAEGELSGRIAAEEVKKTIEHTQANLIKYATDKGYSAAELGPILKAAGFSGFDPNKWDAMIAAVDAQYQKDKYDDSEDGQIP
jgi:hypothetical protein